MTGRSSARLAGVCAFALLLSTARPCFGDAPPSSKWSNPFCAAVGELFAWNEATNAPGDEPSNTYALYIWSSGLSKFSVRMTFVDAESAYTADISQAAIRKDAAGHNLRSPFLVTFDHPVSLSEQFVDAVGIDGGAMSDCPSFVQRVVGVKRWSGATPDFEPVAARFLQTLPASSCGKIFTPIRAKRAFSPRMGHFGDRPRDADVEVFVDSSGRVVSTRIWRSSGVDGIDDAAIGAAQRTAYEPAEFLCIPVVNWGIFRLHYKS